MSMKIITGSTGSTHVTSNNDGELQQAIFGAGLTILPVGDQLKATVIDNNKIRISDGDLVFQGRHALIEPNTHEDLTIESGTSNYKRIDLVVVRYEMDTSSGYENITLKIVKGTPTTGNPQIPQIQAGNIRTGAKVAEAMMYRININGLTIASVDRVQEPIPTIAESVLDLTDSITMLLDKMNTLTTDVRAIKITSSLPSTGTAGTLYFTTT